ncbi:MAG: hypothetical protein RL398_2695, partial [Planctomycetota bacterium]
QQHGQMVVVVSVTVADAGGDTFADSTGPLDLTA